MLNPTDICVCVCVICVYSLLAKSEEGTTRLKLKQNNRFKKLRF